MTRYINLAEYLWLSEQVTGGSAEGLAKSGRIDLADSALHAPMAGFGEEDFYPDVDGRNRRGSARRLATPTSRFRVGQCRVDRAVL
ncbi:MAG: hypothetical protein ACI9MX_003675 [Candidatus Aldehydirespiratoraceae bacterium]